MTDKDLPSPELLRKLLRYEPDTGKLFWLPRPVEMFASPRGAKIWSSRYENKPAFTCTNYEGYKKSTLLEKTFLAHRVAWALYYGQWPKLGIDHINGDRQDNRISNLREASRRENARNSSMSSNNTSGFTGVVWHRPTSKWRAGIMVNRKHKHLGYFDNIEDAAHARKMANIKYGFTSRHGL